jgi:hypothetical protein
MDSSDNYPSSLFRPPNCEFQDFCNGLNFTTFSSFYHQLNPYNPPNLQYIQQHWIVLINELFPIGFDERCQGFTDNPVAQKLKFQAFEPDGGEKDVEIGDRRLSGAKQDDLRKWYKSGIMDSKMAQAPEVEIQYRDADGERLNDDDAEHSHSVRDHLFTYLISSSRKGDFNTERFTIDGSPTDGLAAERAEGVQGDEIVAQFPSGDQALSSLKCRHHRGKRGGKKTREATIQLPFNSVNSHIRVWKVAAAIEDQVVRSEAIAGLPTSNGLERSESATDQQPLFSVGRLQGHQTQSRVGRRSDPVDPCSLSQAELDVAIAELLSTIQSEMSTIHPDRLKKATWV